MRGYRRFGVVAVVAVLIVALGLMLAACGGDGDSNTNTNPPASSNGSSADTDTTDPDDDTGGATTDGGGTGGAADAQRLIEVKCSQCHSLDRVWAAKKDRDGWVTTVDRMKRNGLVVTDQEYTTIIEYLASL